MPWFFFTFFLVIPNTEVLKILLPQIYSFTREKIYRRTFRVLVNVEIKQKEEKTEHR